MAAKRFVSAAKYTRFDPEITYPSGGGGGAVGASDAAPVPARAGPEFERGRQDGWNLSLREAVEDALAAEAGGT